MVYGAFVLLGALFSLLDDLFFRWFVTIALVILLLS